MADRRISPDVERARAHRAEAMVWDPGTGRRVMLRGLGLDEAAARATLEAQIRALRGVRADPLDLGGDDE